MDLARNIIISQGEGIRSVMSLGHIGTADGSSFIRLGGTGILCGIKLEFLPALEASQTEGQLGEWFVFRVTCRY